MVSDIVQEGIEQRTPFVIEYRIITSNGEIRWLYEKGQGIFGKDETLLWLDGAVFDITERKQKEKDLNETAIDLEDKNENLERFHRVTVDRELEMIRLKEEVNSLREGAGLPGKYEAPEKVKEDQ